VNRISPPEGWRLARFADVVAVNPKRRPNGTTFVAMEDVDPWRRHVARWSSRAKASGARFRNADTLLARITPCLEQGKTALVDFLQPDEEACGSTEFMVLAAKPGITDPNWVFYAARSEPFRTEAILSMTGTSGRQRVMREAVDDYICDLPPLKEQQSIGNLLSLLDEKIELNRRSSSTFEKLARVLFAAWFGYLNPVQLQDQWTAEVLRDHLDVVRGLSYTGAGLATEGVALHNLDSIYEGGGYKYGGIKHYQGVYKERHIVRPGDVIVANLDFGVGAQALYDLGVAKMRIARNDPTEQSFNQIVVGCPAIVPGRFGDLSLFSADLFRIRAKPGSPLTSRFIYLMLISPRLRQVIVGYSNGTSINHLPVDALHRPRFALPPAETIRRFDELVSPMFARQEQLQLESETLAKLRDFLLPKLMSGEIRLKEAEQSAAEAL
jgi:type I restriction enzyme, S subunit